MALAYDFNQYIEPIMSLRIKYLIPLLGAALLALPSCIKVIRSPSKEDVKNYIGRDTR